MRVGILGTRGIPNAYGGFEQFAEYLSLYLKEKGHEVIVYNSHLHPYQESTWKGVQIVHYRDWEDKLGTAGQFIYDLNCIRDARGRNFDVLLQLGYTSSSIWAKWLPKKAKIMSNMDGMEWKRSKFSGSVQHYLRWAERWAVKSSDLVIADSLAIKEYLDAKYAIESTYIAYGAPVAPVRDKALLTAYDLKADDYHMLVARMEPENNIKIILEGHEASGSKTKLIVVGDSDNAYSHHLREQFIETDSIRFLGGIFEVEKLDCLRQNCRLYFHGHSVGGTNPSLLEAMGCGADIVAHDNPFNAAILGKDAQYFSSAEDVSQLVLAAHDTSKTQQRVAANINKVRELYAWDRINAHYEKAMLALLD